METHRENKSSLGHKALGSKKFPVMHNFIYFYIIQTVPCKYRILYNFI